MRGLKDRRRVSEITRHGWIPAAIIGGTTLLGSVLAGSGSSSAAPGAPRTYYDQLTRMGDLEANQAEQMFNMYKYGTFEKFEPMVLGDLPATQITGGRTRYTLPDGSFVKPKQARRWLKDHNEVRQREFDQELAERRDAGEFGDSMLDLDQATISANMELLPKQTELAKALMGEGMEHITARAPLIGQFYNEAGNVDPDTWAGHARAGVAQEYGTAAKMMHQNMLRSGARPGEGRMSAMQADMQTDQAKATAGAATAARRAAEAERFNRLSQAVGGGQHGA